MGEAYETQAKGIRIFPGQWRPHYPWEHIAWVSPSWPCQDYLWLDFPEAVFTDQGLLYLSHINPPIPQLYPDLPAVPWRRTDAGGISFERNLPNGAEFGGIVEKKSDTTVALTLRLKAPESSPLTGIFFQTCVFLRACREFSHYTMANKYVHIPSRGWVSWLDAFKDAKEEGRYRLGWRSGPALSDRPMMVARSSEGDRCVSMTWFEDTFSLVGNPGHPCFHADPKMADLKPGEEHVIHGELVFHEEWPEGFVG